jgi:Holliday junction resolvasome RuvABC endonuclease subunit
MIVAGIDPSLTNTGIAILVNGAPALITSTGVGSTDGKTHLDRNRRIRAVCNAVINRIDTLHKPINLAVIEDQLEHGPMLPSALDRSAVWNGIYSALDARKIPVAVINPSTLKVWVTGHGRASKGEMLTTVRAWWPGATIRNHDQADAAALALIGALHVGDPLPFEPKDRHTNALTAVAWPEAVHA